MKAMIWKELRENAKWAILAALGFGILCLCIGPKMGLGNDSLLMQFVLLWTTLAPPLIGGVFGLIQILPDLDQDLWAFLMHRPASRTTLFFGKVCAGGCLYLLTMAVPYTIAAVLFKAPLVSSLVFHNIASMLSGFIFYFAGMLAALRCTNGYINRGLAIAAALLPYLISLTGVQFWPSLVPVFVSMGVLMTAAWGSFITSGDYKTQPWFARFALGLVLGAGIFLILAGGIMTVVVQVPDLRDTVNMQGWITYALLPGLFGAIIVGKYASHPMGSRSSWFSIYEPVLLQYFAISASVGVACALIAYFIGLRCGWNKKGRLAWAFGIFWLGIPGLLMLLALDRWPAREPCPVCSKQRVVTRALCEHCGAPFAAHRRDGTEIFELEAAA